MYPWFHCVYPCLNVKGMQWWDTPGWGTGRFSVFSNLNVDRYSHWPDQTMITGTVSEGNDKGKGWTTQNQDLLYWPTMLTHTRILF